MTVDGDRATWLLAISVVAAPSTVGATVPAARISQGIGRKPVIYAAAAISAIGMTIAALAPSPPVVLVGAVLIGLGAGSFLSVDWALMTEIIPRASSGRYMGISNVATATNGRRGDPHRRADHRRVQPGRRARARAAGRVPARAVCFAIGALLLRPVIEPRRGSASA